MNSRILWMSPNSQYYEEFIEDYKEQYLQNQIIKKANKEQAAKRTNCLISKVIN